MTEDGVREIHLSGKQLVFLFMAVTAVAVVIFLCGVLVGRGVRTAQERAGATPVPSAVPGGAPAATPGTAGTEALTYPRRLAGTLPPEEELVPRADAPPAPVTEPAPNVDAAPSASVPAGEGYAVQVAALRSEAEAAAIAQRLVQKGYPAYVVGPSPGAPVSVYRVRVGKFPNRQDAEAVVRRLEQEEQFRPWITR